jgi:hypothetical protein
MTNHNLRWQALLPVIVAMCVLLAGCALPAVSHASRPGPVSALARSCSRSTHATGRHQVTGYFHAFPFSHGPMALGGAIFDASGLPSTVAQSRVGVQRNFGLVFEISDRSPLARKGSIPPVQDGDRVRLTGHVLCRSHVAWLTLGAIEDLTTTSPPITPRN